jgi:sulfoxide reductase heme-binding subunit YedZ
LHRWTAATGVLLLVAHVVSVVVDPHATIDVLDVVVPFDADYRSIWTGLGTVAVDLLLVVVLTSLLRSRLRPRLWRAVHLTAYAAWALAVTHGLGAGTDAGERWVAATTAGSVGLVLAAAVLRLGRDRGRHGRRYTAQQQVPA